MSTRTFPDPPPGYRFLREGEKPETCDMAFNILSEQWEPIPEHVLVIAGLFSENTETVFRVPPVRQI